MHDALTITAGVFLAKVIYEMMAVAVTMARALHPVAGLVASLLLMAAGVAAFWSHGYYGY